MKKFFLVLLVVFLVISCSNNDKSSTTNKKEEVKFFYKLESRPEVRTCENILKQLNDEGKKGFRWVQPYGAGILSNFEDNRFLFEKSFNTTYTYVLNSDKKLSLFENLAKDEEYYSKLDGFEYSGTYYGYYDGNIDIECEFYAKDDNRKQNIKTSQNMPLMLSLTSIVSQMNEMGKKGYQFFVDGTMAQEKNNIYMKESKWKDSEFEYKIVEDVRAKAGGAMLYLEQINALAKEGYIRGHINGLVPVEKRGLNRQIVFYKDTKNSFRGKFEYLEDAVSADDFVEKLNNAGKEGKQLFSLRSPVEFGKKTIDKNIVLSLEECKNGKCEKIFEEYYERKN